MAGITFEALHIGALFHLGSDLYIKTRAQFRHPMGLVNARNSVNGNYIQVPLTTIITPAGRAYTRFIPPRVSRNVPRHRDISVTGPPASSYISAVLALSPVVYYPLNELTGTVADNAEGTAVRDGTYNSVNLNNTDGPMPNELAGLWNASLGSFTDFYSASFESAWNGQEYSVSVWSKVFQPLGPAIWQLGGPLPRFEISSIAGDYIRFYSGLNPGDIIWDHTAGGLNYVETVNVPQILGWWHQGVTFNVSQNRMRFYYAGVEVAPVEKASVVNWTSTVLSPTECVLGANSTLLPSSFWNGHIAHVAVFSRELTPSEMLVLGTAV